MPMRLNRYVHVYKARNKHAKARALECRSAAPTTTTTTFVVFEMLFLTRCSIFLIETMNP